MATLISKGEFRYRDQVGAGIVLGMIIGFFIYFLVKEAKSYEYINIPPLIPVFFAVCAFIFMVIKFLRKTAAIDVYDTHLVYKKIIGKKSRQIFPEQILQYGEAILKKNNHIYIQVQDKYLSLPISMVNNDIELLHQLLVWGVKRRDNIAEKVLINDKIENKLIKTLIVFMACGITYNVYISEPYYPTQETLTPIVGNLSKSPEIKTPRKAGNYVLFSIKEYPSLNLKLGTIGYKTMHKTALSDWPTGTEAVFWITNNDFHKYFIKDSSLNYIDKHFNFGTIDIYGVTLDGNNLLTYQDYSIAIKAEKEQFRAWAWLFIFGLLCFVFRKQLKARFSPYRIVK